jgi:hypothetical protein
LTHQPIYNYDLFMSGTPELRSALIEAGMSAPRVEGVLRYQTAAGLQPKLRRGRRAKDADDDLDALNYAKLIVGFSAINPIDAPAAVALIGRLQHTASTLNVIERDEDGEQAAIRQIPSRLIRSNVLLLLSTQIQALAELPAEDRKVRRKAAEGLFIRIDIGRREASIPYQLEDNTWGIDQFSAPKMNALIASNQPRLSWGFEVKLELDIVFIAADLLAQTLAKRNRSIVPSEGEPLVGGSAKDIPTTTNDNAPDLAGSGASRGDRDCNQSRFLNASRQSDASEDREDGIFVQLRNSVCGWVSSNLQEGPPTPCPLLMA